MPHSKEDKEAIIKAIEWVRQGREGGYSCNALSRFSSKKGGIMVHNELTPLRRKYAKFFGKRKDSVWFCEEGFQPTSAQRQTMLALFLVSGGDL